MNEDEEIEDMGHVCTSENKITVKIIVGAFIAVTAIYPICSTVINSSIKDHSEILDLKLNSIRADVRRNELRATRLEGSIISSESKLIEIDKKISDFVSELKYVYPTKDYVDSELKKKVDYSRIDKRNLKD